MGNCWEAIDLSLDKLLEVDDINTSANSSFHTSKIASSTHETDGNSSTDSSVNNRRKSNSIHEASAAMFDEVTQQSKKSRVRRIKLNTIIEDSHEDLITSPFLFHKVEERTA